MRNYWRLKTKLLKYLLVGKSAGDAVVLLELAANALTPAIHALAVEGILEGEQARAVLGDGEPLHVLVGAGPSQNLQSLLELLQLRLLRLPEQLPKKLPYFHREAKYRLVAARPGLSRGSLAINQWMPEGEGVVRRRDQGGPSPAGKSLQVGR